MISRFRSLAFGLAVVIAAGGGISARAQTPVAAPETASQTAQFYVLSFTDAPIGEVAEAVVGGALSRDLTINPAIDGTMSFSAEGRFTPEALLQEFGTAALDQDVALIQSRSGNLSLIPRANMAAELAVGSQMVALAVPKAAPPARVPLQTTTPVIYGKARWWDGTIGGMLIFLTGAACGAGALSVGRRILYPAGPPTSDLIRITHAVSAPVKPADGWDDPELVIPRFESRAKTEPMPPV